MTMPSNFLFRFLGFQGRSMSRNCKDERMAMLLKNVAIGSLIIVTGITANQVLDELFGRPDDSRNQARSRRPCRAIIVSNTQITGQGRQTTGRGMAVTYAQKAALLAPTHSVPRRS